MISYRQADLLNRLEEAEIPYRIILVIKQPTVQIHFTTNWTKEKISKIIGYIEAAIGGHKIETKDMFSYAIVSYHASPKLYGMLKDFLLSRLNSQTVTTRDTPTIYEIILTKRDFDDI